MQKPFLMGLHKSFQNGYKINYIKLQQDHLQSTNPDKVISLYTIKDKTLSGFVDLICFHGDMSFKNTNFLNIN